MVGVAAVVGAAVGARVGAGVGFWLLGLSDGHVMKGGCVGRAVG